ncbi:ATP-binding protein [Aeromicrobium fastidiosum]|uniref:ATP-binding protein n=1 Tax=Aeromicrobium fastidiosum TaxID=52699 RepID=UPI00165F88A8|nr:ATP-binding protein [Aeromicrobium fastidiosum]MBP2390467.1 DNA gyrase subunit B [Aeromicrobium fastidiosum]
MLAYALDEAAEGSTRAIEVIVGDDDSIAVRDDGRGTDTRRGDDGTWVVKPVMATPDLRFFDVPGSPQLPDGLPRSGMSVVAALSSWLVHTNVRAEGAWSARYVRGIPDGRPASLVPAGLPTGTTVSFVPDPQVFGSQVVDPEHLGVLLTSIDSTAMISLTTP